MRPLRESVHFVLLMCMAAASLSAQEERALATTQAAHMERVGDVSGPALSSHPFTLFADVNEVQVEFSAMDRDGHPFSKLRAQDLQVIADGRPLQDIKSFGQLHVMPITLGILVDRSESMKPEMHLQAMTFSSAAAGILEPSRDREFAVAFSNKVTLLQPKTDDFLLVKQALEQASGDHNLTSLYDAIVYTCREQFGAPTNGSPERRILLLFSDGVDNLSIHSLEDAIELARASAVAIYAVAPAFGDEDGRQALQVLTNRTGGRLELLHRSAEPEVSLASIRAMVGNHYALTFRPPNTEPGFHRVELKAISEESLVIHAPAGYYVGGANR